MDNDMRFGRHCFYAARKKRVLYSATKPRVSAPHPSSSHQQTRHNTIRRGGPGSRGQEGSAASCLRPQSYSAGLLQAFAFLASSFVLKGRACFLRSSQGSSHETTCYAESLETGWEPLQRPCSCWRRCRDALPNPAPPRPRAFHTSHNSTAQTAPDLPNTSRGGGGGSNSNE